MSKRPDHFSSLTRTAAEAAAEVSLSLESRARFWLPWPARGASLVGWRSGMDWTQADAASALGVGLRTYVGWEGSKRVPRRVVLACWALAKIREGVE